MDDLAQKLQRFSLGVQESQAVLVGSLQQTLRQIQKSWRKRMDRIREVASTAHRADPLRHFEAVLSGSVLQCCWTEVERDRGVAQASLDALGERGAARLIPEKQGRRGDCNPGLID